MKTRRLFLLVLAVSLIPMIAAAQTFSTTLTGAAEKPTAGDPDGSGIAVVTINGTTLTWTILVTNINPPTASHIHLGAIDVAGGVVVNFNPSFVNGTAAGTVTIATELAAAIAGNPSGYYVNVHTSDFPDGAVRGQLGAATTGGGDRLSYVPVVGKVAGAAGTNFVTDVRIVNESNATANVTLDYFQRSGPHTAPTATRTFTVSPGEQEVLDDVIGSLSASDLGGLRITSDQNVTVASRIINDLRSTNQGTTGFATNAMEISAAKQAGTISFLSQSSSSDVPAGIGFRTNLGYFNPTANAAAVTFTARRTSDGTVLGTRTITVPAYGMTQQAAFALIDTVAAANQVQPNFYVSWTSDAPLFVYGSVVDNKTGDSVLIQ